MSSRVVAQWGEGKGWDYGRKNPILSGNKHFGTQSDGETSKKGRSGLLAGPLRGEGRLRRDKFCKRQINDGGSAISGSVGARKGCAGPENARERGRTDVETTLTPSVQVAKRVSG